MLALRGESSTLWSRQRLTRAPTYNGPRLCRPPLPPPTGRPPPAPFGGKTPDVVLLSDPEVQPDSANKEKLRVGGAGTGGHWSSHAKEAGEAWRITRMQSLARRGLYYCALHGTGCCARRNIRGLGTNPISPHACMHGPGMHATGEVS